MKNELTSRSRADEHDAASDFRRLVPAAAKQEDEPITEPDAQDQHKLQNSATNVIREWHTSEHQPLNSYMEY